MSFKINRKKNILRERPLFPPLLWDRNENLEKKKGEKKKKKKKKDKTKPQMGRWQIGGKNERGKRIILFFSNDGHVGKVVGLRGK